MSEEVKVARTVVRLADEEKMFYTGKPVRENTTFGFLSAHLAAHPGISVKSMIEYMEENFKPSKSEKFGKSFCRAYVRGMVKEGYAHTDEDAGPGANELVEPAVKVREKAEKPLPPQSNDVLELLKKGPATITELCAATGKNKRSINATVRGLLTKGVVSTQDVIGEDGKAVDQTVSIAA